MAEAKLKTIKISRKTWYTAPPDGPNSMLRIPSGNGKYSGHQCCLGFAARALGCTIKDITGVSAPGSVNPRARRQKLSLLVEGSNNVDTVETMMEINDSDTLTRREKEQQLRPLAEEVGLKFVFVP